MPFSQIPTGSRADAVIDHVETLIVEGVLAPGHKFPGERDLAAKLNVSRPVLREALKTLHERGLIITRKGGGTYVADLMGSAFSMPLKTLFARHDRAKEDYLEFRIETEGTAAALAALRSTETDREILTRIFETMTEHHKDPDASKEADSDVRFHMSVVEASHNVMLIHVLRSVYDLLRDGVFHNRATIYESGGARTRLYEQHAQIFRAIMDRDPDAARAAVVDHLTYVGDHFSLESRRLGREQTAKRRLEALSIPDRQRL